jgi:hypothetical protein
MMTLSLVGPGRCRLGPCSKVNINTVPFLYINNRAMTLQRCAFPVISRMTTTRSKTCSSYTLFVS